MYIKWINQAYGFNQATYPNKNYDLSASLITGEFGVEGDDSSLSIPLGHVTVEEDAVGRMRFLFGSQRAFWAGADAKLATLELSSEQLERVVAELVARIPRQTV
ncbi:MAG: hypothetical protein HQL67_11965 [Magnetococcales bacterium]|nr:hypothetical protein [Magnetococcales bacterium]